MDSPLSAADLASVRAAGQLVRDTLDLVEGLVVAGAVPAQLDAIAEEFIRARGGIPAFKGMYDFPATLCISTAPAVVHGTPSATPLQPGDVVCIDGGAIVDGWYADSARTVLLQPVADRSRRLLQCGREALAAGIGAVRDGVTVGEVSKAIGATISRHGFRALDGMAGHGIGRGLHEDPRIANEPEDDGFTDWVLRTGMLLCIEPMVVSDPEMATLPGDAYGSVDGLPGVHVEHMVLVGPDGAEILT